ncbi:MAG TPA: hypothetical protein VI916_10185 [Acidimicrobiia bacterium]|nr:hypothetical protein [Acidimicrobiia bacterium]
MLLLVLLATWVLFPFVLLLMELVVIALVAPLSVVAQIVLRRPWIIEAAPSDNARDRREWKCVGWRASGDFAETVAEKLQQGIPLPISGCSE